MNISKSFAVLAFGGFFVSYFFMVQVQQGEQGRHKGFRRLREIATI